MRHIAAGGCGRYVLVLWPFVERPVPDAEMFCSGALIAMRAGQGILWRGSGLCFLCGLICDGGRSFCAGDESAPTVVSRWRRFCRTGGSVAGMAC